MAPSIKSRVDNVAVWFGRLNFLFPITEAHIETVRFDMQKMVNPEISYMEYQRWELAGFELREYLLEKFKRTAQGYAKDHWIDAACVGESGAAVAIKPGFKPLDIKATGRGTHQTVRTDRFGFPRGRTV